MNSGIDAEFSACSLGDKRLDNRLIKMAGKLFEKIGSSIPMASGNWADTKAVYRFLDHSKFSEDKIIEGHLLETVKRFQNGSKKVLILHDTTELTYHRKKNSIGKLKRVFVKQKARDQLVTIQGLLFHTSLAVTLEGLPIGISALKLWTRKKFKDSKELSRHVNPTRVPIETKESFRWIDNVKRSNALFGKSSQCIHIGDREADIYELYSECQNSNSSFVIRVCNNRKLFNSEQKLFESVSKESAKGFYAVTITDKNGEKESVQVEVRFKKVNVMPPIGKEKNYPKPISACYIEVKEKMGSERRGEKCRVEWKLLTNLPVANFEDAFEKIQWYAMRWKIELFFKILKSGCKTEESKLRNANRLAKFITICSVIAWKVFWLTMLNRTNPVGKISQVLSERECDVLDKYMKVNKSLGLKKSISDYLIDIAKLGGYLNRKSDPPPGNMVIWRGISRLNDLIIGFKLAKGLMGN